MCAPEYTHTKLQHLYRQLRGTTMTLMYPTSCSLNLIVVVPNVVYALQCIDTQNTPLIKSEIKDTREHALPGRVLERESLGSVQLWGICHHFLCFKAPECMCVHAHTHILSMWTLWYIYMSKWCFGIIFNLEIYLYFCVFVYMDSLEC